MKKWMVYFINNAGHREGTEYINAHNREEAEELYRRFFNVSRYDECRVIPVIEKGACS